MPNVPSTITYLEKVDRAANESKFWAVRFIPSERRTGGVAFRLWWGRIATNGQSKDFDIVGTDGDVLAEVRTRVEEKLREGYVRSDTVQWFPNFLKTESTAGQTPVRFGSDGWPVVNGREVRPQPLRSGALSRWPRPVPPEPWPDLGRSVPSRQQPVSQPKVVTIAEMTMRVIDFEE